MTSNHDKSLEPESFKVVILGDAGVGKTSIINRYIKNTFKEDTFSTTGGSYFSKMIQYPKHERLAKLDIWDTAGQERYRAINKIYYQKCNGVILVYDITRKSSLEALTQFYDTLVSTVNKDNIVLVVVGNKNDLYMQEEVSDKEGKAFATEHNAMFRLTSALNSNGITDMFEDIGLELLKKGKTINEEESMVNPVTLTPSKDEVNTNNSSCIC